MIRWIAEIGSNHLGSLNRCYKLIDTAKEIGCESVKFQLSDETLYAPQYKEQQERLRKWQLPVTFVPLIAEYCKEKNIKFGCTPFYLEAVDILEPYVDFFKIGSYELLWLDLIRAVAKTGKPMILSIGMGTGEEIEKAVEEIEDVAEFNYDLTLLNCNSSYPAFTKDCDLTETEELLSYYNTYTIGWSDHTRSPGVIYAAIAHGAEVIEFHLDLEDGQGWESEYGHCWSPHEIEAVIDNVRIGEIASQPNKQDLEQLRQQRTDVDGMRPMKQYRKEV